MDWLSSNNLVFGTEDLTGSDTPVVPFPADVSQLQAGGRYSILGMVWHIEYVTGDQRSGRGPDGTPYTITMPCAYGEIEKTKDADGEPIDILINQEGFDPKAPVRIMDMVTADTGEFDEHKLWVGFPDVADMDRAFSVIYGSAPVKNGGVLDISLPQLKTWSISLDTLRPVYDRDAALQASTLAKMSEKVPVVIPPTTEAPKVLVDKTGANMKVSIYILSEFGTKEWGPVTETIIDLLLTAKEGDTFMIGISSYGGELDLAARIASAIRQTAAHVTTVSLGPVASAGCLLWCEGHTRLITRGSYFMQHDAGCFIGGKVSQISRFMEATKAYLKSIVFARAVAVGLLTPEEISALVDRSLDLFISAREAARRTNAELL